MPLNVRGLSSFCVAFAAGAACVLLASCANLAQGGPEKAMFTIDPGEPPLREAARSQSGGILQVRRLHIISPYNGTSFVYRLKDGACRSDYYNAFVAPPDQLMTSEIVRWLSAAGPFEAVVDASSAARGRLVLEGTVTSLYGDYTDPAATKAVLTLRVFLLDESGDDPRIVVQKEYRSAAPIRQGDVQSLVSGWSSAFRDILSRMTVDLNSEPR